MTKNEEQEQLIAEQISDILSFGIEMNEQEQKYVRSCMHLVWATANLAGFNEGCEIIAKVR